MGRYYLRNMEKMKYDKFDLTEWGGASLFCAVIQYKSLGWEQPAEFLHSLANCRIIGIYIYARQVIGEHLI
jgi:hypothetical protein